MTSDDAEYYRGRVAVERDMARHATNPYARRAHQELADNYAILCRLLRAKPRRPARTQPTIERIEFTTLIQSLAHPHSTYLVPVPGWSLPASPERPTEPILTIAAEWPAPPGPQVAISKRPSAYPIFLASTVA